MDYPPAVIDKAQRLAQLLQRVEAGEAFETVCSELGINIAAAELPRWQARYVAGDRRWEALLDGRFGHTHTIHAAMREWLYERKRQDPTLRAPALAAALSREFGVNVSAGHINYLLRKVGLTSTPGQPYEMGAPSAPADASAPPAASPDAGESAPVLANAGLFSLTAAQQAMGITEVVETALRTAIQQYQTAQPGCALRVLTSEPATWWHKLDHLLYLPILGLERPADLYYYQGPGLQVLYGFTYKYLPLEHFLGQLTRLQLGYPLAAALSRCYSQAWHPGDHPLFIFTDWHDKPWWTKWPAHSGPMSMWGRVMPGTKQLLLNGPEGHLLGGWDYAVDTRLPAVLVDLEATLATTLQRPIAYTVCDSEGGGLPTGQRYAAAGRHYISVLPHQGYPLHTFTLQGAWAPVEGDPSHEAVAADWADVQRAQADPLQLVLMRRLGDTDPTRVYAGCWLADWPASTLPSRFRQRWACQERRIRELVNGANLNANYGYTAERVPNRTQQRRWAEAQALVEVTEAQLAEQTAAITHLTDRLAVLEQTTLQTVTALAQQIAAQASAVAQRQAQGQAWRRLAQGVVRLQRSLQQVHERAQRHRARLQTALLWTLIGSGLRLSPRH